jgi:hypothetical protein
VILDKIPKPETFWYEDKDGNKIFCKPGDMPSGPWEYQYFITTEVSESVCTSAKETPKWLKFIDKIYKKIFGRWAGYNSQIMKSGNSVNCITPIVKYLIDKGWNVDEACIIGSGLCERCLNIVLWEVEGGEPDRHYLNTVHTECKYCKIVDPKYAKWRYSVSERMDKTKEWFVEAKKHFKRPKYGSWKAIKIGFDG